MAVYCSNSWIGRYGPDKHSRAFAKELRPHARPQKLDKMYVLLICTTFGLRIPLPSVSRLALGWADYDPELLYEYFRRSTVQRRGRCQVDHNKSKKPLNLFFYQESEKDRHSEYTYSGRYVQNFISVEFRQPCHEWDKTNTILPHIVVLCLHKPNNLQSIYALGLHMTSESCCRTREE
jgi:hypothetical protein